MRSDPAQQQQALQSGIYSKRKGDNDWEEIYAFADAEFFASDFAVLSYYTMKAAHLQSESWRKAFIKIPRVGQVCTRCLETSCGRKSVTARR